MPVRDAQRLFRDHIQTRLERMVGDSDIDATFTLVQIPVLTNEDDCLMVEVVWQIRLHLIRPISPTEHATVSLCGSIPIETCLDGNLQPIDLVLNRMWEDQKFGWLMVDGGLDQRLERVVHEAEG